jgi:outer membrane scaffolding protein for murein synthesis (MipA/OmpV family)
MKKTVFRKFGFGFAAALALVLLCNTGVTQAGAIVDYEGIESIHVESKSSESGKRITVGAGIAIVPDYEGSDYYEAAPLLHFRMAWENGRYLDFTGNRVKFNIMKAGNLSIGPMVRVRAKRDDDVEDTQVSRMKEVDTAVELGGFVAYNLWENFEIGANLVQDVADGHDGYLVGLHVGYKIHKENMMIGLKAFTTYVNNDYMEAYFSVNFYNIGSAQLRPYDADDGFKDVGVTCVISYQINESWGATGVLGFTRLIGDAKDSPVVDDRGDANQLLGGIMGTYRF